MCNNTGDTEMFHDIRYDGPTLINDLIHHLDFNKFCLGNSNIQFCHDSEAKYGPLLGIGLDDVINDVLNMMMLHCEKNPIECRAPKYHW